jgi:hypothetical protein
LAPEITTSFAYFSVSVFTISANSATVVAATSPPPASIRSFSAGEGSALTISSLSRAMRCGGVPAVVK